MSEKVKEGKRAVQETNERTKQFNGRRNKEGVCEQTKVRTNQPENEGVKEK